MIMERSGHMHVWRNRIGLVLASAAVLQCLASCGEVAADPDSDVVAAAVPRMRSEKTAEFKSCDFGGDEFKFLIYDDSATDYIDDYIWVDGTGDSVCDAVVERNREVQRKYNATVTSDRVESPRAEAIARMNSGQYDFDVIYDWGTRLASLSLDGMLYDFKRLEDPDYTQSYWIPSAIDDLTIAGKMYVATNYITMNSFGWADVILYNRRLEESLGFKESVNTLVLNGKWMFDAYIDRAIAAESDLNGDGIMSTADRFGIWGDIDDCLLRLTRSAGITSTEKQSDGSYKPAMYNETVVNIYSCYKKKLDSTDTFVWYKNVWNENIDLADYKSRIVGARAVIFTKDHVLFMPGTIEMMRDFVGMGDACGIAPNPMYSESQERYYNTVDCKAPMFALPNAQRNTEMTGVILEYMAYLSERTVIPAYYSDVLATHKNCASDDEKIIDIIRGSVKYDWASLYGLVKTGSMSRKMLASGNFATTYTRLYDSATAEIDNVLTTLYSLN